MVIGLSYFGLGYGLRVMPLGSSHRLSLITGYGDTDGGRYILSNLAASTGDGIGVNLGVNPVRNLGVSTTFAAIPPRGASSTEVAMTPSKWGFCGDSVWDYHTIESSVSAWTLAPIRNDLIWQVLNTALPVTNPSVQ